MGESEGLHFLKLFLYFAKLPYSKVVPIHFSTTGVSSRSLCLRKEGKMFYFKFIIMKQSVFLVVICLSISELAFSTL